MTNLYDVFISYGRADSKHFAVQLNQQLMTAGLNVWFDFDDIPAGVDYQKQIDAGIERAHNFLYVISPHAVNSPYCEKELILAQQYNKRIIPLLHVEEIDHATWRSRYPDSPVEEWHTYQESGKHSSYLNMAEVIRKIQWLLFREGQDDYAIAFQNLLRTLEGHRDYVRRHTLLLTQAMEWKRLKRPTQKLLVGEERQQAEAWLKLRFPHDQQPCRPTTLQCEFITESIKNANNLMTQVFLAYGGKDQTALGKVSRLLMREGITLSKGCLDGGGPLLGAELREEIERADNFVLLASPEVGRSPACLPALHYASSLHKRILVLPVEAWEEADPVPPPILPQGLEFLLDTQGITLLNHLPELLPTLQHEAIYYQEHKTLLVKALKWERQNRNPSILLRGYSLRKLAAWLSSARQHPHHPPVPAQEAFVEASLQQPPLPSLDVFIAYSRTDADFARQLNDALQIQGKTTWFDQESIALGVDFQSAIFQGIEESDNIVFILSPRSMESVNCAAEVERALQLNKRIIPVLYRKVTTTALHPALAKLQWVDFNRDDRDFYINFGELIRALDTDREHVRSHTKWLQRAIEWDQHHRSTDLLLRGAECTLAAVWLQEAQGSGQVPLPTSLQQSFIEASLQAVEAEREREKRQAVTLRSLLTIVGAAYAHAEAQRHRAEIVQEGQISALSRYSQALRASHQGLEALVEAMRAGRQLQRQMERIEVSAELRHQVTTTLREALFDLRERNLLTGHGQPVTSVCIHPQGTCIATTGLDQAIRLWSPQGQLLQTLQGHTDAVLKASFSPQGDYLVTAGADKTLRMWNLEGCLLRTLEGHTDWVYGVSMSPQGNLIASGSVDQTVKLWTPDGQLHHTLSHPDTVVDICFSPDGRQLAAACADHTIHLWSLPDTPLAILKGHENWVTSVRFHPQGQYLASSSLDKTVRLWNLGHLAALDKPEIFTDLEPQNCQTWEGHGDIVWSLAFSPDGQMLASTSGDRTIRLWNLEGQTLLTLRGHQDLVTGICFSPTQPLLASTSYDKTLRLWQYAMPQRQVLTGHTAGVNCVTFSPQGDYLVTASTDTTVQLWTAAGQPLQTLKGHQDKVKVALFSPDGQRLATASIDKTVKLWSLAGEELLSFQGHDKPISSLAFSPDGQRLATASYDRTIKLWNLTGELLHTLEGHDDQVWDVAFSPDGKMLASVSWDRTIRLWTGQGQPLQVWSGHQDVITYLSFHPKGHFLATASQDKTVKLWTLKGQCVTTLVHEKPVMAVGFSPDGRWIATAGFDQQITFWTPTGQRLNVLQGHTHTIWDLAFRPDGQVLASASEDGSVRLWSLDLQQLQSAADLWILDLANLLQLGYHHAQDYFQYSQNQVDREYAVAANGDETD